MQTSVNSTRVLVACEYSGTVRNAFSEAGFDAWSCDLLDSESPGNHYKGDVIDILSERWDLLIAHPPCTYLSYAGTKYWNQPGRVFNRLKALELFATLWTCPIKHICIENPLGCVDNVIEHHSQIINPWYFGEPHLKRTCLWLKNLPLLQYQLQDDLFGNRTASDRPAPIYIDKKGKKRYFTDAISGHQGEGKSFKQRSVSFPSIAKEMVEQWSGVLINGQ